MRKILISIACVLSFGINLYAVQSASWEINNPEGWRKGELQGAVLSADGSLTIGVTTTKIALPSQPITDEDTGLWCNVTINDRIYFGSAKGMIYSLNQKEHKLEPVFNTEEMLVTAMIAYKDELYAGTIPNGKIFKVDKSGKGSLFCTLPANGKYIWQLCFDGDKPFAEGNGRERTGGHLYAATGPEGKIYKIDNTGKAGVLYDTKKKNVLSLIFDGKEYFYAGTDDPGIVYRISLKGRPEIVADFGDMEIRSLVYSAEKKELFIGANKGIKVAPQEFLGLIQQSARKAAVTPPVPGQNPKDVSPNDTKPTPPKETPKHDTPHETPRQTPAPADKDHGDHHPPAPPAPNSPQRDREQSSGAGCGTNHKSTDANGQLTPDEILEKIKEMIPTPMQDEEDGDDEPSQSPAPAPPPPPVTTAPAAQHQTISAQPPPEAPRPPVHCVIYKLANGLIKEITALNDCYITEIKLNSDGVLVAGTDNSGRIYYVFPGGPAKGGSASGGQFFIPYDLDAGQVLTLVMDKDNQLFAAGTGKKAAVYLARTDLAAKAEFTTDVWDARFPSRWGNFSFKGQGSLLLQVQSGNTAKPDETWSDWSEPLATKAAESVKPIAPTARYFRVKLGWDNKDTVIKEITQNYLAHNQQPKIMAFNIAPVPPLPPTGVIQKIPFKKINYQVRDPDGDAVSYRIYYRAESQKSWIMLNQEFPGGLIFQPEFNWMTDSLADGLYFIKLEATDEKVNPNGTELKDEKISEAIVVDNTKPEINIAVDKKSECSGKVTDALSQIRRIEYSLDGGKWEAAFPADGIMDSNSEDFKFALPALGAGFHVIAVRAFDEFGNMGLGQMEFEKK